MQVQAAGDFSWFRPQAPNRLLEMNPEIVRLLPHECEEHLDAHCVRQILTSKGERQEQLPFDERQGVDFGVHFVCVLVLAVRAADNGTTGTETTAKGHQLAHPDDNLLVEELAGVFGLFVFAQGVIKRHEQPIAGRVNVQARYDLAFDQAPFPDIFVRPVRYDCDFQLHVLTFYGLGVIVFVPDPTETGRNTPWVFEPCLH